MFNRKNKEYQIEECQLEKLLKNKRLEDKYILDDENAIILIHSDEPTGYIMIHVRIVDGNLVEMNRWPLRCYYFGTIQNISVIRSLNLFQVQNGRGNFNGLYNYKEAKFVVSQNIWADIYSGRHNNYLKKYGGFLASFSISSDYEEGDTYSYNNIITGERIVESFIVKDDNYYAILNIDGTIKSNKLFKGTCFSKIKEIINLDEYESLDEFKKERKKICNDIKRKNKQAYYELLNSRSDDNISPYLDSEVAKILNLKK